MTTNNDFNFLYRKRSLSLAISAALTSATAVEAQENRLEEIIITSTKRELNLQDTPLSVTAITNADLTLLRLKNFSDYVGQIPNISLSERNQELTP